MPKIEEAQPKYLQIAHFIRDQILRGDLSTGDEVPSERQLSADWSVSRPTAARALEALRHQGLVEKRQGSGTYDLRHTGHTLAMLIHDAEVLCDEASNEAPQPGRVRVAFDAVMNGLTQIGAASAGLGATIQHGNQALNTVFGG